MNIKLFVFIPICCLVFFPGLVAAQDSYEFSHEIKFIRYLMNKGLPEEACTALRDLSENYASFSERRKDTINFLLGEVFTELKRYDTAATHYNFVSGTSPFYKKALFKGAYAYAKTDQWEKSRRLLQRGLAEGNAGLRDTTEYYLRGLCLLKQDLNCYRSRKNRDGIEAGNFGFIDVEKLDKYYQELQRANKKSPWMAGFLSVLIPGLGKVYAGKPYEGLASFFTVSSLGYVVYENYRQRSLSDPMLWAYGGVFLTFYAGNIWGSAFRVKIHKQHVYKEVVHQVMLDWRISVNKLGGLFSK